MTSFSRDALHALAYTNAEPCVSIYMPTVHVESELAQNAIRLKNLLREARRQLAEHGFREAHVDAVLLPLHQLMESTDWGTLSDGLAAFVTLADAYLFHVALPLNELVVTGSRFHLKPLFPLLASNNRFYVLSLSQNRVRLFQGTHYAIEEMEVPGLPKSLSELLALDETDRSLQAHTGARTGGRHTAVFHGAGEEHGARQHDELRRYFRQVDEAVRGALGSDSAPLLIACVDYYLPLYREVNTYPHLVPDQIIAGNPDQYGEKALHEKAWAVTKPLFLQTQRDAIHRFAQLGTQHELASGDLREIVPAAAFSRIDTLFVPIGRHQWGRYQPDTNAVILHEKQHGGDEDLYDFAAVQTFLHGGTVHAMRPENMPVPEGLAAMFRYPAQIEAAVS